MFETSVENCMDYIREKGLSIDFAKWKTKQIVNKQKTKNGED